MNWEAIGAVGEILGAATVIATLFYLARQVRHATSVAQASARQAISQMNVDAWDTSVDSSVLSRALSKLPLGEELTPEEHGNFVRWVLMRMRFMENAYYQHTQGLLDPDEWSGYVGVIANIVGPGSIAYEARALYSAGYSPRFVEEVQRIQATVEPGSSAT